MIFPLISGIQALPPELYNSSLSSQSVVSMSGKNDEYSSGVIVVYLPTYGLLIEYCLECLTRLSTILFVNVYVIRDDESTQPPISHDAFGLLKRFLNDVLTINAVFASVTPESR